MAEVDETQWVELLKGGIQVRRGTVKAGSFLFLPLGSFVAERTIGEDSVIGLRTSALDDAPKHLQAWLTMYDMLVQHESSESAAVKLFSKFKFFMQSELNKLVPGKLVAPVPAVQP